MQLMIIFFFKIAFRRFFLMVLAICRQGLEIQNIPDRIPPLFSIADASSVQHFALHRLHRYTGCIGYTRYTDYTGYIRLHRLHRLHRYTGYTVSGYQRIRDCPDFLVRQLEHFCHINQPFSMPSPFMSSRWSLRAVALSYWKVLVLCGL
jgi:hypothetical protein